ncbi:MAG: putative small rane protein [Bacteroidota bacterium]|nr:putative small rane protein [Bacteroidota bacterium]
MQKTFGIIASLYGMLAVILGAFGAHALKDKLDAYQHTIYEKAVSYQFYHVAALLGVAFLSSKIQTRTLLYSGWFFTAGILLFSGSLYLLSTRSLTGMNAITPILGPVTPLGGLCLIIGWILLLISFTKL